MLSKTLIMKGKEFFFSTTSIKQGANTHGAKIYSQVPIYTPKLGEAQFSVLINSKGEDLTGNA